jgi:hypothetical protein
MRPAALFLALALSVPAAAAHKVTGPAEVKAGGFAQLSLEGAGKPTVIWSVSPEPVQDSELFGVLVFTGRPGVEYTATAIVIDFAAQTFEKVKYTVRFLGGPAPPDPPGPKPPTPPVPPVPDPPAPIPVAGLHVLIVYESAELPKMPAAQQAIIFSQTVRDSLNIRCAVGPDGKTRQWRMWDKDTKGADDSPLWAAAMARPRQSVPWVIVSNGKAGFEGPLPATAAEFLELVNKYDPSNK